GRRRGGGRARTFTARGRDAAPPARAAPARGRGSGVRRRPAPRRRPLGGPGAGPGHDRARARLLAAPRGLEPRELRARVPGRAPRPARRQGAAGDRGVHGCRQHRPRRGRVRHRGHLGDARVLGLPAPGDHPARARHRRLEHLRQARPPGRGPGTRRARRWDHHGVGGRRRRRCREPGGCCRGPGDPPPQRGGGPQDRGRRRPRRERAAPHRPPPTGDGLGRGGGRLQVVHHRPAPGALGPAHDRHPGEPPLAVRGPVAVAPPRGRLGGRGVVGGRARRLRLRTARQRAADHPRWPRRRGARTHRCARRRRRRAGARPGGRPRLPGDHLPPADPRGRPLAPPLAPEAGPGGPARSGRGGGAVELGAV
ncbi:MAG: hypothetical protein AVDCRST_MAG20-2177, partial [uncultured Acidimicrobiales bacterium]